MFFVGSCRGYHGLPRQRRAVAAGGLRVPHPSMAGRTTLEPRVAKGEARVRGGVGAHSFQNETVARFYIFASQ
jgi:hypothetical protein